MEILENVYFFVKSETILVIELPVIAKVFACFPFPKVGDLTRSGPRPGDFFLERLTKNRWGCSFSIFDDQKGNTDSKHTTSRCFYSKIDPPENLTKVFQKTNR